MQTGPSPLSSGMKSHYTGWTSFLHLHGSVNTHGIGEPLGSVLYNSDVPSMSGAWLQGTLVTLNATEAQDRRILGRISFEKSQPMSLVHEPAHSFPSIYPYAFLGQTHQRH